MAGVDGTAQTVIGHSHFVDNTSGSFTPIGTTYGGGAISNFAGFGSASTIVSNSFVGLNLAREAPGGMLNWAANNGTAKMAVSDSSVVLNNPTFPADILSNDDGVAGIAALDAKNNIIVGECSDDGHGSANAGCP